MIFNDLATIHDMMISTNRIKWAVEDPDKDVMKELSPGESDGIDPDESFNQLQRYIGSLRGNGYVVIKIYSRNYKPNSGGELKKMVRAFNFAIGNYGGAGGQNGLGGFSQPSSNGSAFNDQLTELKILMAEMKKDREIEKLQREIESLKKDKRVKPEFFSSAIQGIGKEIVKELISQNGYTIEGIPDDDDDESITLKKKDGSPGSSDQQKEIQPPAPVNDDKILTTPEAVKMIGSSTQDLLRALDPFGITPGDFAKGMAEMAAMAKNDPLKFKEKFESLTS